MPSFVEAVRLGVDVIEFDVLTTLDGVVICHHDPLIEETGKKALFSLVGKRGSPHSNGTRSRTCTQHWRTAAVCIDCCCGPNMLGDRGLALGRLAAPLR